MALTVSQRGRCYGQTVDATDGIDEGRRQLQQIVIHTQLRTDSLQQTSEDDAARLDDTSHQLRRVELHRLRRVLETALFPLQLRRRNNPLCGESTHAALTTKTPPPQQPQ